MCRLSPSQHTSSVGGTAVGREALTFSLQLAFRSQACCVDDKGKNNFQVPAMCCVSPAWHAMMWASCYSAARDSPMVG